MLEHGRRAARLRGRGLRAARPRRARPDARRDRPRARRQGVGLAVLLPHRRRAPTSSSRWSTWRWTRPARRVHHDDPAGAGQAARDGGHRLPRPGRRRRLPDRGPGHLPRRHLGGAAGGVPLRRDPRRRRRCRVATPRSAPASARRQARTARTPAGSSGCTGSTRWRCSPTRPSRSRTPSTSACSSWEKEWLDKLELAYRVIDVAAGDLGLSAQRKFDCEAWMPTQGRYRELTSTSNCTDFQTRRLDIRGRFERRTASSRSRPSTAPWSPSRAPSWRSSRPTSRPTARCGCRRRCSPTCRDARSSSPSTTAVELVEADRLAAATGRARHRRHPAQVGRGRRPELRADRAARCTTPCTRAVDAGAHIVLASGRSPHGMTKIADLLDLPARGADRLWVVASNGAVIFRYPPLEVVHEETFDARRGRAPGARAAPRGPGGRRGARRRLPRQPALPRRVSSPAR